MRSWYSNFAFFLAVSAPLDVLAADQQRECGQAMTTVFISAPFPAAAVVPTPTSSADDYHPSTPGSSGFGAPSTQCGTPGLDNIVITWSGDSVPFSWPGGSGTTTSGTCVSLGAFNGQIAVGTRPSGNDTRSIIELFAGDMGASMWPAFDVSYIVGYSVPITCQLASDPSITSGCNIDLFARGACAEMNEGTCVSPVGGYGVHAPEMAVDPKSCWNCSPPERFFSPCAGGAYTFPDDNSAVGTTPTNDNNLLCCIGTNCPTNTKQGSTATGLATDALAQVGCTPCGIPDKRDTGAVEPMLLSKNKRRHAVHKHGAVRELKAGF